MTIPVVVVEGTVKPDGMLELHEKLGLPPGRVQVTIMPKPELPKDDPFWQMMERLWAGQRARGHVARSVQEVEADRERLREEWEERMRRLEHIQAEADAIRSSREQGA